MSGGGLYGDIVMADELPLDGYVSAIMVTLEPNARDYCTGRLSALAYRFNPNGKKVAHALCEWAHARNNDQRAKQ